MFFSIHNITVMYGNICVTYVYKVHPYAHAKPKYAYNTHNTNHTELAFLQKKIAHMIAAYKMNDHYR